LKAARIADTRTIAKVCCVDIPVLTLRSLADCILRNVATSAGAIALPVEAAGKIYNIGGAIGPIQAIAHHIANTVGGSGIIGIAGLAVSAAGSGATNAIVALS
jgi:hypothetical protein